MRGDQIISIGEGHSLVIGDQGQVYATGANFNGRLGLGDQQPRNFFEVIPGLPPVRSVQTRTNYSAFLTQDGQVYLSGNEPALNLREQGTLNAITSPVPVPNLPPVKFLAAGYDYLLLLDDQGKLYGYGARFSREFGPVRLSDRELDNRNIVVITPHSEGDFVIDDQGMILRVKSASLARSSSEIIVSIAENYPPTVDISLSNWGNFSLILDTQGQVWGLGTNYGGQIGLGDISSVNVPTLITGLPPIKKISAGYFHSLLLDEQGRIWAFGSNERGAMGIRDEDHLSEQKIDYDDDDQPMISYKRPVLVTDLPPIVDISAGNRFNLTVDDHGLVYGFGDNFRWQLGFGPLSRSVKQPTIIPDIRAKVSDSVPSDIITVYPIIQALGDRIVEFRVRSFSDEDTLAEYVSDDGTIYVAQIKYDPATDQQNDPLENVEEKYYLLLEQLIKDEKLTEFELASDYYEDELGNKGFMFKDPDQQIYLIRVYEDSNGDIHRPL